MGRDDQTTQMLRDILQSGAENILVVGHDHDYAHVLLEGLCNLARETKGARPLAIWTGGYHVQLGARSVQGISWEEYVDRSRKEGWEVWQGYEVWADHHTLKQAKDAVVELDTLLRWQKALIKDLQLRIRPLPNLDLTDLVVACEEYLDWLNDPGNRSRVEEHFDEQQRVFQKMLVSIYGREVLSYIEARK